MEVRKAPWAQIEAHVCCTCEYWGGERNLEFSNGKLLYVRAQNIPQARCPGPLQNAHMSYDSKCCSQYKRWHMLPD